MTCWIVKTANQLDSIQAFRNLSNVFEESFDSPFAAVLARLLKCTCLSKNSSQNQRDTVTGFFVL